MKLALLVFGLVGAFFLVRALFADSSSTATVTPGGARIVDGRFENPLDRRESAGFLRSTGFSIRKISTSIVARDGAAKRVPFDRSAMAHNPSITWIGHSTFLTRMDGVTFLTDPVFSKRVSPVSFAGPKRAVDVGVPLEELPAVDFVLISHNHYDHADRDTVRELARRGVKFFVPLGVGELIREEGGEAVELDWWQNVEMNGVHIHCVPAQHFSGRSLTDRNRTLWAGWVVKGATRSFYHTGDTGYSPDFKRIRERLGSIDLAAVPIGAYSPGAMMSYVHTTPEEAVQIGVDVGAGRIMGMRFGTFDLADEPLDEPPVRFRAEAERRGLDADRAWVLNVGETRSW